jgi:hypothetical protein
MCDGAASMTPPKSYQRLASQLKWVLKSRATCCLVGNYNNELVMIELGDLTDE